MSEYKPWVSEGITEVEYWKKRYLEARIEAEAARAEALEEAAVFAEQHKFGSEGCWIAEGLRSRKGTAPQSTVKPGGQG